MRIKLLALFFVSVALTAFEQTPWFPEEYIFDFKPSYTYSSYPYIQNGTGSNFASNNNEADLLAEISFFTDWDLQCEIAFMQSRLKPFGFEQGGLQLRYCCLDDIRGDLLSVVAGFNLNLVPSGRLKDPTVPFHNIANFELSLAIGKELSNEKYWMMRSYALLKAGIANKGSPWIKAVVCLSANAKEKIFFDLEGISYFGFGAQREIDPYHFHGYGDIHHSSIDLAIKAHAPVWKGELVFAYTKRLLAESFPASLDAFTFSYWFYFPIS